MTDRPTPRPSGRTAQEILDYADPNHPADFWRKQEAQRQLFDALLEIVKQVEQEGSHYYDGEKYSYSDNGDYALEQVEQKLRIFFGQAAPPQSEKGVQG